MAIKEYINSSSQSKMKGVIMGSHKKCNIGGIINSSSKVSFANAVVLAAGLAFLPGCKGGNEEPTAAVQSPSQNSRDQRALLQKISEMAKESPELLEHTGVKESSLENLKAVTTRFDVRDGENDASICGGTYSNHSVGVTMAVKINEKGVELNGKFFEYSKPYVDEVRAGGSFLLTTVTRAEKSVNGNARLFITHTDWQLCAGNTKD